MGAEGALGAGSARVIPEVFDIDGIARTFEVGTLFDLDALKLDGMIGASKVIEGMVRPS